MKMKHILVSLLIAVAAGGAVAQADVINLDVAKDNFMWERPTHVNANMGTTVNAQTGVWQNYAFHSLVAFDVSALAGQYSDITGMTLHLYVYQVDGGPITPEVYAVTQANGDWGETTSTWNEKDTATSTGWAGSAGLSTADVDYDSTALGIGTVTSTGWVTITLTGDLTALVDGWLSGNNAGLLLAETDPNPATNGNSRMISYTKDQTESDDGYGLEPYLEVTYTAVPEPATMAMLGLGGMLMLIRRRRNA